MNNLSILITIGKIKVLNSLHSDVARLRFHERIWSLLLQNLLVKISLMARFQFSEEERLDNALVYSAHIEIKPMKEKQMEQQVLANE